MELQTAFQKTWDEVELALKDQRVMNHELFAFVFCKAFESNAPDLHAIYDARLTPDQGDRPNLFIWADKGEPTVIFMGAVNFKPESLTVIYQRIEELNAFIGRPLVEVLKSHDSAEMMNVASDVEFGCFIISDLAPTAISKGITSLSFCQHDLTRFHFAYGSVNGHSHFEYQEPRPMRIKK